MERTLAYVTGIGTLNGAFTAGSSIVIGEHREKIERGFTKVRAYATSVGVFSAAYLLSGQYKKVERFWRNCVGEKQLIDPTFKNILKRQALKLEYLEDNFSSGENRLDLDALFGNEQDITFVVTDLKTGTPKYITPKRDNIFKLMIAACSLPFVRKSVQFEGFNYIDGGLTDPLPIKKALDDGCDRVIAMYNYPENHLKRRKYHIFLEKGVGALYFMYPETARLIRNHQEIQRQALEEVIDNPRVTIIRPSGPIPLKSNTDTSSFRIGLTVEEGKKQAEKTLAKMLK